MTIKKLNLAKLRVDQRLTTENGMPTSAFVRWLNDALHNIEQTLNAQTDEIALIETALTNAGIALTTATNIAATTALATSYTDPGAILSADISPADSTKAKITIAAHNRVYPKSDGTVVTVAVAAGTIDLLPLSTIVYVYYDQSSRAGGTVTYQAATGATAYLDAAQAGDRHCCGSVLTPAAAGPPVIGGGPRPLGVGEYRNGELIP